MQVYSNLQSLLEGIEGKEINEWVYANRSQVIKNPINSEFYIFTEDELWDLEDENLTYENKRGDIIPIELIDKNLDSWMTIPMIEDVIEVLKQNHKNPDKSLIAKALLYYFKYDAFME